MVQQTDSKFSEYVLANSETGFTKQDKKTALRDLQNENRNTLPKSDQISPSINNGPGPGPAVEPIKHAGTKRSQQTPASNNRHLVYVRRKTESEQHKNRIFSKSNEQHDEKNHEPKTCEGVSGKPDISPPLEASTRHQLNSPTVTSIPHWEERYFKLQSFLKSLDSSNQDDYLQMLSTLSPVRLSRVAVELEKRSFQLSMEEAKEVRRAKLMNVLDKFPVSTGEQGSAK